MNMGRLMVVEEHSNNKAIALTPGNPDFYNDYAWFLAACPDAKLRDPSKAALLATLACNQTGWSQWQYIDTAAVAYAAQNNFDKAIDCEQHILQLTNLDQPTRKDIQQRLDLFKQHQPYHDPAP